MAVRFDDFTIDTATREIHRGSETVHVEPQVFDVLAYLIANHGRVVPKSELLDEVWGDQFVSESALTTRIKSARRAVGDDGRSQRVIKNIHGIGYRFVAELAQSDTPQPVSVVAATATTSIASPDVAMTIAVDDEFPFVGRDDEIAAAWPLLDSLNAGPAVVLVGGSSGVGKSRLAVELAERTATEFGAIVGAGRCDEQNAASLQAWRDALHQLATAQPEAFRRWAEPAGPAIATLSTGIARLLGTEAGSAVDDYTMTDAIVTLLDHAASEQPITLVFDDIQWSDEPSRAAIGMVLRRLAHRRVAVIASFRTTAGDLPDEVRAFVTELGRSPRVARLDLAGLDPSAVSSLASQVLDKGADVDALYARTAGHGLFVTESLRELHRSHGAADALPASVAELIAVRLARLDDEVRAFVTAGAVLGPEFPIGVASEVAGLTVPAGLAAVDVAIRADLVHQGSTVDRIRFSHQVVPAAILDSLTAPARMTQHERCAAALESLGADPAETAPHLLAAVPLVPAETALGAARVAVDSAVERNHYDQAVRLLEHMLQLSLDDRTRTQVELDLGEVLNDGGRVPTAVPIFDRAAGRARDNGWNDLMIRAAFGRAGRSPYRRLADVGTLELLEEVAEFDDLHPITHARIEGRLAAFRINSWRLDRRDELSTKALSDGRAAGAAGTDLLELLEARWVSVGCPSGASLAAAVDDELGELRSAEVVYGADAAMAESSAVWFANGEAFRSEAAEYMTPEGSRRLIDVWRHHGLNGTLATFEGRFDEARAHFDEAGVRGELCWGESGPVLHALAHLGVDALSGSANAPPLLEAVVGVLPTPMLFACQAWSLALAGHTAEAAEALGAAHPRSIKVFGEHIIGGPALIAAGEAAVLLDDQRRIEAAKTALEPLGHLMLSLPWAPTFAAADTLATICAHQGDTAADEKWTTTAAEVYESLGAPALRDRT